MAQEDLANTSEANEALRRELVSLQERVELFEDLNHQLNTHKSALESLSTELSTAHERVLALEVRNSDVGFNHYN